MTKLVKDYIANKIREGAQPRLDTLNAEWDKLIEARPKEAVIFAEMEKTKEYKAAVEMVTRIAKNHGARVAPWVAGEKLVIVRHNHFCFEADQKALKALQAYKDKIEKAITEALVSLELAKTKVDVDLLISQAIASLK